MDWKIIPIFAVLFLLLIPFAWAKQPAKYMSVFPFGADDFIMYAMTFMPSLDLTIKNLIVTGVLTAYETHFINTTVTEINVTSNMTVQDTVTAKYFNGSWNGSEALNNSIKEYVDSQDIAFNDSMKGYADSQDTAFNDSIKLYVDSQDTAFNDSIKVYVDTQDTAFNDSMKDYADDKFVDASGDNVTGPLEMGLDANITDANSGSYMYFKPGGAFIVHLEAG